MRITNKMLSNNFLNDMQVNLNNLQTLQQQMTSGKQIRKPSDDPFKAARIMQLYADIGANEQYNSNITSLKNWQETTDTALNDAGNVLQRINELMVAAGNAAYGSNEMKAIKDEVNQKVEEFSQIMNTNYSGRYVFGGSRVDTKPTTYTTDAQGNTQINYNILPVSGDQPISAADQKTQLQSRMSVEVSTGVTVDYNVPVTDIVSFNSDKGTARNIMDMFKTITANLDGNIVADGTTATSSDLTLTADMTLSSSMTWNGSAVTTTDGSVYHAGDSIPAGKTIPKNSVVKSGAVIPKGTVVSGGKDTQNQAKDAILGDTLQSVKDSINNILSVRASVGAKENRMETAKTRNEAENDNMKAVLSSTEDIDITETTMKYATMQTVYQASLQTSAKVIQPTLLDYIG
ncbi:flagellar hook-associated protein FlgL [Clostridium oryzae]|uniref:Flagellin n=1 Tax=Clostridium oryzae TaxID=1450648 RepID=A0A1V4IM07_9CLOT|nr:flagellar hook-associated protein FlgL [Clostridium oryzae]OPJ60874.1 flagellin [Clostridium oryzae]